MKITVHREIFTEKSTISKCYVDGAYECFILAPAKVKMQEKEIKSLRARIRKMEKSIK